MSYSNFSSLPPEEEQQFVVFERRSVEASRKAMTIGLISSGLLGLFITILVLTSEPPAAKHTDALESDIPAETTTPSTSRATTPDEPAPAAAEAEGEAAEGEAAEGEAAEGEAADRREAPPPPKGATKAPPTALVGE
jgi:hypothetical protein